MAPLPKAYTIDDVKNLVSRYGEPMEIELSDVNQATDSIVASAVFQNLSTALVCMDTRVPI